MTLHYVSPNNSKKLLTTGTFHWIDVITAILGSPKIFSLKKTSPYFFQRHLQEVKGCILGGLCISPKGPRKAKAFHTELKKTDKRSEDSIYRRRITNPIFKGTSKLSYLIRQKWISTKLTYYIIWSRAFCEKRAFKVYIVFWGNA